MSDEDRTTNTQVRIEAVGLTSTIADAEELRLVVEGPRELIAVVAEQVVELLTLAFGGEIMGISDGEGNDLSFAPVVIDPLDTGDGAGEV
jgi:hypothetical protein